MVQVGGVGWRLALAAPAHCLPSSARPAPQAPEERPTFEQVAREPRQQAADAGVALPQDTALAPDSSRQLSGIPPRSSTA